MPGRELENVKFQIALECSMNGPAVFGDKYGETVVWACARHPKSVPAGGRREHDLFSTGGRRDLGGHFRADDARGQDQSAPRVIRWRLV
jgi:hypothetical protein